MKGAFQRGSFDVTSVLKSVQPNVLAVRISPPPHPGIPQEQSILGGPGENGGALALDGPTFVATEGWDWIPGVRDRNSGICSPSLSASRRASSSATPRSSPHSRTTTHRRRSRDRRPGHESLVRPGRSNARRLHRKDLRPQEPHPASGRQCRQAHSRGVFPTQPRPPASLVAQWIRQPGAIHRKAVPPSGRLRLR